MLDVELRPKTFARQTTGAPPTMKQIRVCIYGGTDLQGTSTKFISKLSYKILASMPSIIVTGGFRHSNKKPHAISTDVAALRGARKFADQRQVKLKDCFEAWIPDPSLDSRPDVRGAVRMSESDGITPRVIEGRTPLGRRLAMVGGVDLVVTISGTQHTEVVVEQALDLGLPVLPIPNAGGDSEELLKKYRVQIAAKFQQGVLDHCLDKVSQTIASDPDAAATEVVKLIRTAKLGRCFVLIPFDAEHDNLYESTIEPAIAKYMIPVRLDRLPHSGAIYTNFADAMESSSAVVADITTMNENVMYEIGYSHGRGLEPLIYTRKEERREELPVYFRTLNIRLASSVMPVNVLIEDYLSGVKEKRRTHLT